MKVKITSPCTAMLLYEAARSPGQTEGGLIGQMNQETLTNITDANVSTTVEDVLSLHTICALPVSLLQKNKDQTNVTPNCYGWFKFCRRPSMKLTVREKSMHRKLVNNLKENGGLASQIITLLVQETWVENLSTYTWKLSSFVLDEHRKFIPCKVEIVNSKASVCGTYKPYPTIHQQDKLPGVIGAIDKLKVTVAPSNSFTIVEAVSVAGNKIMKLLDESAKCCNRTEALLCSAYSEQAALQMKLKLLKDQRQALCTNVAEMEEIGSCSSESSDEDLKDSMTKTAELLIDLHDKVKNNPLKHEQNVLPPHTHSCTSNLGNCLNTNVCLSKSVKRRLETPPPSVSSDPFDSLVDLAKAELLKPDDNSNLALEDNNELTKQQETLLAEYNDDRSWAERTRSGRKQPKNED
uniref:Uncharacterized protein n=1 Tax=Ciona savignyi TaxID=51511 RepID=H2ZGQ8_CIOSA